MSKVCIIIPCYNEAGRIDIKAFINFIQNDNIFDFHFVNDGSTDHTIEVLHDLKQKTPDRVSIQDMSKNSGKAEAVRQGVLTKINDYEYLGYLDADLATPLTELILLYKSIDNHNSAMVLGSRVKRLGAKIERSFLRHILGRVFATFVSKILALPVYDSQCGAKLIRADIAKQIFADSFLSKWLFDVELLFRIKKITNLGLSDVIEKPLNHWEEKEGSRIKPSDFIKFPIELIKIYSKYK